MKPNLLFLLLLGVIFCSFATVSNAVKKEQSRKLKGKWTHTVGGEYVKNFKRTGEYPRWYKFEGRKHISFSSCTDMCGCLRRTDFGTYAWENDSVIAITYTHFTKHGKLKMCIDEPVKKMLQVVFKGENRINLRRVK